MTTATNDALQPSRLGGEFAPGQWLRQDISNVVCCRDFLDLDQSQGNIVPNKVDERKEMFRSLDPRGGGVGKLDCRVIILKDHSRLFDRSLNFIA